MTKLAEKIHICDNLPCEIKIKWHGTFNKRRFIFLDTGNFDTNYFDKEILVNYCPFCGKDLNQNDIL
jgi:hypothetical protein